VLDERLSEWRDLRIGFTNDKSFSARVTALGSKCLDTLVVDPRLVNLVELCPFISEVLTFEPRRRFGKLELYIRALQLAAGHLWRRQFDLALLPRWDSDYYHSAFVAYFSGALCRVGYSENVTPWKKQDHRGLDILFTRTLDDRTSKHDAERNLDFLRQVGGRSYGSSSRIVALSRRPRSGSGRINFARSHRQ
jgi:ADP-heptose:LPS heptosyltransferase